MTELLAPTDVAARIAALQAAARPVHEHDDVPPADAEGNEFDTDLVVMGAGYHYVRPFSHAADGLIETTVNADGRFMLGMPEIDLMMRGVGRGELCYVTGRAHSGKTQVVLNAVRHNQAKRVLWFTPDEVAELLLSKLVAMTRGLDSEHIERSIREDTDGMQSIVKRVATVDFRNLIVVDDSLTLSQMSKALKEAEHMWGAPADCVVIDFLELIPGGEGEHAGVTAKSQALKRWSKHADVPVICLHQSSRTGGKRGQSNGMDAMRYGGETEAIFVLEVYRKRDDDDLDEWDRTRHQNTVTVAVHKNKRPPCKVGNHDYYLDPSTGLVRGLQPEDLFEPQATGVPIRSAAEAHAARSVMGEAQAAITKSWEDVPMTFPERTGPDF